MIRDERMMFRPFGDPAFAARVQVAPAPVVGCRRSGAGTAEPHTDTAA